VGLERLFLAECAPLLREPHIGSLTPPPPPPPHSNLPRARRGSLFVMRGAFDRSLPRFLRRRSACRRLRPLHYSPAAATRPHRCVLLAILKRVWLIPLPLSAGAWSGPQQVIVVSCAEAAARASCSVRVWGIPANGENQQPPGLTVSVQVCLKLYSRACQRAEWFVKCVWSIAACNFPSEL